MSAWRGAIVDTSHMFGDLLQENLTSFGFEIVFCGRSVQSTLASIVDHQPRVDFILWHSPPGANKADDLAIVREFHLRQPGIQIFLLTDLPHHHRGIWQAPADESYVGIARVLSRDIPSAALKYMLTLLLMERRLPKATSDEAVLTAAIDPAPRTPGESRPNEAAPPSPSTPCPHGTDGGPPSQRYEKQLGLSDREQQILSCLVQGQANKAIARMLSITEGTVKVHIKSLLRKIKVRNRTQAAIWAIDHSTNGRETNYSASLSLGGLLPNGASRDVQQGVVPRTPNRGQALSNGGGAYRP